MTAIDIYVYAAPFVVMILAYVYYRYESARLDAMQAEIDSRKRQQPGE